MVTRTVKRVIPKSAIRKTVRPASTVKTKTAPTREVSLLSQATPLSETTDNLTCVIYGPSGTGKTHIGSTFPKPILFLDVNEDGEKTLGKQSGIKVLKLNNWTDVEKVFWELHAGSEYKTIVVDQFSNLLDLAKDEVRRKSKKVSKVKRDGESKEVSKEGFSQRQFGLLGDQMKDYIANLKAIRNQYHIVALAHERIFTAGNDEDDESVIAPVIGPNLTPVVEKALLAAFDIVINTHIRETWVEGANRIDPEVKHVQYCAYTGPNATRRTKIRRPVGAGPLPDYIVDPSYHQLKTLSDGSSTTKKIRRSA